MSENSESDFVRLRLWPALIIVVVELTVWYLFGLYGSTNLQSVAGNLVTPLSGTIAVLLWWLLASRAPWRDRILGVVLFATAVAAIVLFQNNPNYDSQKNSYNGGVLLAQALPVFGAGTVLALFASKIAPWRTTRLLAAIVIIA